MKGTAGFPLRLRFTEHGKVRFVSHRDIARAFDRAFRVEQLALAFTEGFSPRPKVSFGLALSVGHESDAEYLDVELREALDDPDVLVAPLCAALPEGVLVTGAAALRDRAPALQEAVTCVEYRITPFDSQDEPASDAVLAALLDAASHPELPVTQIRKGESRVVDVKPVIRKIELAYDGPVPVLELSLSTQPRGARPREVLDALAIRAGCDGLTEGRVVRTAQWIERDGARMEPLEADALTRPLEVCAS